MKMSKIISLVLVVVMALSMLVACKKPTNEQPQQGGNDVPNPLAGTYNITMWVSEKESEDGSNSVAKQMQAQIDDFMKANPGIVINATISGVTEADAGSQVVADVATAPDIYCFAQDQLARLVQAAALAAPGGDIAADIRANNDAGAVAAATVAGTLYAYPMTSDNGYYMYYDKSVITNPESLEAIIADCNAAFAANEDNRLLRFGLENGWYTASFFFGAGCHSNWTMNADGDFNGIDDNFNSEAGLVAMKGMQKLAQAPCYDSDNNIFTNAAVVVTGIWNAEVAEAHFGENFAVTDLPSFEVDGKEYHLGSFSGNKLMGVKPQSDSKKAAVLQLLAHYLTSEKCQLERYEMWQWGPSNLSAQASQAVQSNPSLAALALQNAYAKPQGSIHGGWWDIAARLGSEAKRSSSDSDLWNALYNYQSNVENLLLPNKYEFIWSVIGNICNTRWDTDFFMTEVADGVWESEPLYLEAGQEFRFRRGASWDVQIGAEGRLQTASYYPANIVVETTGTYVIRLEWDGVSEIATVSFIPCY